jgi:hypothetical protein
MTDHILLRNRCVLQLQHVDCKIPDSLLKKGTKQHANGWDSSSKDWSHIDGLWLSKDDLQDSSSWSSPPLLLLRDIHSKFLSDYDCKEACVPSQSPTIQGLMVESVPRTVSPSDRRTLLSPFRI